jgi:hypothetical protein
MAIIVRWKLLARKAHDLEEVDFLLGLGSLIKVFRYGIHIFRRRPLTSLACFAWIAFNAVGRVSVALTGLTYSYDSAGAASSSPGIANVTDWTKWTEADAVSRDLNPTPQSESYSAHSYGLFSVLLKQQYLTKPGEQDPNYPLDKPIEYDETGAWYYYMREYNPHPKNPHSAIPHKSKRSVKVDSMCDYFPMTEGQKGDSSTITYLNGTRRVTLNGITVSPIYPLYSTCLTSPGLCPHGNNLDQPPPRPRNQQPIQLRPSLRAFICPPVHRPRLPLVPTRRFLRLQRDHL